MRGFIVAAKSHRIKKTVYGLILLQIGICFTICLYIINSMFNQFDILLTANGSHRGYLYLSKMPVDNITGEEFDNETDNFEYLEELENYKAEHGIPLLQELTEEQEKEFTLYLNIQYEKYVEEHRPDKKYGFTNMISELRSCSFLSDVRWNTGCNVTAYKNGDEKIYENLNVMLVDEYYTQNLKMETRYNVDISALPRKENHFYVIRYPNYLEASSLEVNSLFKVGDVISEEVFNSKKGVYETLSFEIVDEYISPAYLMPGFSEHNHQNSDGLAYAYIEQLGYNGEEVSEFDEALVAVRPADFEYTEWWTAFSEGYIMVKPADNFWESQYDEFCEILDKYGYTAESLHNAEKETVENIWDFIREKYVIFFTSLIAVLFSVIATSILSSSTVRREYSIYMLCGASKVGLCIINAKKWLLAYIPGILAGGSISIILIYSTGQMFRYIVYAILVSLLLFAVLFAVSVFSGYISSIRNLKSTELYEWEGRL